MHRVALSNSDKVGFFAAQHAQWLKRQGVECAYLRPPVADAGGSKWKSRRKKKAGTKPRILIFGMNLTFASRKGVRTLTQDIMPNLEKKLGINGFEVRILQGTKLMADEDHAALHHPSIQLLNYVSDLGSELAKADVVCFPLEFPVGVRTGIITAFSSGACVVAQESCRLGAPEIVHGENALLAKTGKDLANAILYALDRPTRARELGAEGRKVFEQYFSTDSAGTAVVRELEQIARKGR